MIDVPFAHLGHALPLLPFFAPPLALTLGGILMIVRDRLRGRERERYEPSGRTDPHRQPAPR
jgi:hypothetical protein